MELPDLCAVFKTKFAQTHPFDASFSEHLLFGASRFLSENRTFHSVSVFCFVVCICLSQSLKYVQTHIQLLTGCAW